MRAILVLCFVLALSGVGTTQEAVPLRVRVVDESNAPIPGATVGVSVWDARRGQFYFVSEPIFQSASADGTVAVRWRPEVERPISEIWTGERGGYAVLWAWAPGYVAKHVFVRYPATELEQTIQLRKGRMVELNLSRSDGLPLPDDLGSQLRFDPETMQARVAAADLLLLPMMEMRFCDEELRPATMELRKRYAPQRLCLGFGIERLATGRYRMTLPPNTKAAMLVVDRPGMLRGYVSRLEESEIESGRVERVLPRPGTLTARYDLSRVENGHEQMRVSLVRVVPELFYLAIEAFTPTHPTGSLTLSDVAPGEDWRLMFQSQSDFYRDTSMPTTLAEGDQAYLAMTYYPFDMRRYQGERALTVRFLTVEGKPLANRPYRVSLQVSTFGQFVPIGQGRLDAQGQVRLTRLYENPPYRKGFLAEPASYIIEIDPDRDDSLAYSVTLYLGDGVSEQVFYRSLQKGDLASSVTLTELTTGTRRQLSEFRGKWVVLDFWATWCEPCQAAFEKMRRFLAQHGDVWRDQLVVFTISLDSNPKIAEDFLKQKGWWDMAQHFWAEGDWESEPARLFNVKGIPHYVIIDPQGRVAWTDEEGWESVDQALIRLLSAKR